MKSLNKIKIIFIGISLVLMAACTTNRIESLVPDKPSQAPDYFCTWNLQGYVVNYGGVEETRATLNEQYLFGAGQYENWIESFPQIRQDLYFVMDDSWDIDGNNPYLAKVELSEVRFPSFKGTPAERLKKLTDKVKSYGWKGLGGWICAQEAPGYGDRDVEKYWKERMLAAHRAGFDYWKVDWGNNDTDGQWRQQLTAFGRKYAPNLYIEHALGNEFITFSDVYRTYDVENIISQPVTMQRISDLLAYKTKGRAKGIINCEDEPYIAVGLGCAIGVMRHSFKGNLPNGKQDHVFPPVARDIKNRTDEVIRGVRWHRIAEPFGVGGSYSIDTVKLEDYWTLQENETWMNRPIGESVRASAPARISRGIPLPHVTNLHAENQPFILTSKYPNGAVAIVSIGRALDREYISSKEQVSVQVSDMYVPIGIFGQFKEVILSFPDMVSIEGKKVWAQDLAGDIPIDITNKVKIEGEKIIISGEIIEKVGLMAASKGDKSDPGLIMQIK